jgi:hypothetical protein
MVVTGRSMCAGGAIPGEILRLIADQRNRQFAQGDSLCGISSGFHAVDQDDALLVVNFL